MRDVDSPVSPCFATVDSVTSSFNPVEDISLQGKAPLELGVAGRKSRGEDQGKINLGNLYASVPSSTILHPQSTLHHSILLIVMLYPTHLSI